MKVKHGLATTPEYQIWNVTKRNCYSESSRDYRLYGGIGIRMCDRWFESVDNFIADMGPRPDKHHCLIRLDKTGNFEPSNCKWARRDTVITFQGVTRSLVVWAAVTGISLQCLTERLKRGWSAEATLTKPVRGWKAYPQKKESKHADY